MDPRFHARTPATAVLASTDRRPTQWRTVDASDIDPKTKVETLQLLGTLPRDAPSVAIVGTRRADLGAIRFTETLAKGLATRGITIVSGGAVGIDAAAHRGALAGGGQTVVVLATSFHECYPAKNHDLFHRVLQQEGALISQHLPPSPPLPWKFLARNRVIASIADVTIVIQAPTRSGALSTAEHARKNASPLLACPGAPWDPRFAGTNALLKTGAATSCLGEDDVVGALREALRSECVRGPRNKPPRSIISGPTPLRPKTPRQASASETTPRQLSLQPTSPSSLSPAPSSPALKATTRQSAATAQSEANASPPRTSRASAASTTSKLPEAQHPGAAHTEATQHLLTLIGSIPVHIADLQAHLTWPAETVQTTLLEMLLDDLIEEHTPGFYRLRGPS